MLGCTVAGIKNAGLGLAHYNAYVNARIKTDEHGNEYVFLQAGYSTVGLHEDGHVDYQMEGRELGTNARFISPPARKAIPHTDPPGPALSEGYTTDDYDGEGSSVKLRADRDASVYA